jgi:ethanolamine utilization protein EutN
MFLGRVVGEVWATKKVKDLEGKRLLVVEALDERRGPGLPKVTPVVAADPLGAALGQHVVVAFGKAARVACGGDGDYAFEAAVVGIVDDFDVPDAPESWRRTEPRRIEPHTGAGAPAQEGPAR